MIVTYACDGCTKHFGPETILSYGQWVRDQEIRVQATQDIFCEKCREFAVAYWESRQEILLARAMEQNQQLEKHKKTFFMHEVPKSRKPKLTAVVQ